MNNLLEVGLGFYGEREIPGKGRNVEIGAMIDRWTEGFFEDDRIAWCSIYMNDVAYFGGFEFTAKLTARSWLEIGIIVAIDFVKIGDVCVLWRESKDSWKGHVGIVVRIDVAKNRVWLLGGNQFNGITIRAYSLSRVLGFRRLRKLSGGV